MNVSPVIFLAMVCTAGAILRRFWSKRSSIREQDRFKGNLVDFFFLSSG